MTMSRLTAGCAAILAGTLTFSVTAESRRDSRAQHGAMAVSPAPHGTTAPLSLDASSAVVRQYCVTCHNDRMRTAGLTLASFDARSAIPDTDVAEKIIRKLRAGMMPPPGVKRPDDATLQGVAAALEMYIDAAALARPRPGRRPFQRLNRAEYARSVRELLGFDVDVALFLPPDTVSGGFDNVADVQASSPTVMEGYLRAATRISLLAVGDRHATATEATYRVPRTASQMRHVEGAPIGTRGGISVVHVFPADGEYSFRMMLYSSSGELYGNFRRGEQLEVSINGERVALVDINPRMSEGDPNGMNVYTPRVFVKAGPQRVSAAFIQRFRAPVDDLIAPVEHTLADGQIGLSIGGVTTLPHLMDLNIMGPHSVAGISDNPVRRRIFACRPATEAEETPCARRIVRSLATKAYRRPVNDAEVARLLAFYHQGRKNADFEEGIRMALQAILASPGFLFRFEETPANAEPGRPYRISDIELASRLSYFLWATVPDAELVSAAMDGKLSNPDVLRQQVTRMLADPRAEALSSRFASQWLRLQDLRKIEPDPQLYPYFDRTLAEAMEQETRMLFDYAVRQDRSVLELLTADYTFVNERLAKHYDIPNVTGSDFRKVKLPGELRRGVLGHGSVLTLTSVADRTSPVLRGKWVLEVLLGSPPPPPPPNVPELESANTPRNGRLLSVRERMEEHRKNPACTSCHKVIDPLGLALENFDVTGAYRINDNGQPIDASGELYDGTKIDGPAGLRAALLKHKDIFLLTFTENLLTYALGRRVESYDMPTVRRIVREAAPRDYRMSSFIMGVINSPAFQMREAEMPETTAVREQ